MRLQNEKHDSCRRNWQEECMYNQLKSKFLKHYTHNYIMELECEWYWLAQTLIGSGQLAIDQITGRHRADHLITSFAAARHNQRQSECGAGK